MSLLGRLHTRHSVAYREQVMLGPLQTIWVEALESGKYPQGTAQLKSYDGRYCCLGVAREVIPNCWSDSEFFLDEYSVLKLHSYSGRLLEPLIKDGFKFRTLVEMNDGGGELLEDLENTPPKVSFTFAEIAAYIRANPENVFSEAV